MDRGYDIHKVKITIEIDISAFAFDSFDFSLVSAPGFYSSSAVDDPGSLGFAFLPAVLYIPVEVSVLPSTDHYEVSFASTNFLTQLECSAIRKGLTEQSRGIL